MDSDIKSPLEEIMESTKSSTSMTDNDSCLPSPSNKNNNGRKVDVGLSISAEEIENLRQSSIDKINEYVKTMKDSIRKDDLSTYMLDNRIEILEKSKYMLNEFLASIMTSRINDSRAYEVLAGLIKTIADINNTVVNVTDDKAKLKDKESQDKFVQTTSSMIANIVSENMKLSKEQKNFKEKEKENIKVLSNDK